MDQNIKIKIEYNIQPIGLTLSPDRHSVNLDTSEHQNR